MDFLKKLIGVLKKADSTWGPFLNWITILINDTIFHCQRNCLEKLLNCNAFSLSLFLARKTFLARKRNSCLIHVVIFTLISLEFGDRFYSKEKRPDSKSDYMDWASSVSAPKTNLAKMHCNLVISPNSFVGSERKCHLIKMVIQFGIQDYF